MKKKITGTIVTVILAASAILSGCAGGGPGEVSDGTAADTQAAEQIEEDTPAAETIIEESASGDASDVTIWYYWETEGHQRALDQVIQDYNASQQEIEVTAKYVPFADFKKQLSIGASAQELPDVVIIDSPDHASYASMDIFADLTGQFDVSGYYEGTVNSCTIDGTLYGIPFGVNCLGLYYNEDMLNEAGCDVPATWDELKETAEILTKDNVSGLAFCSVQNEEGTFNFVPWLWSTGASSYEIDSEGGIRALTFVKDLVDSGAMSKECINWTQGDVMNQFISENAAMMVNGPWQIPTMKEEAPDLNWKVALIPMDQEYASVLGGENYAVIAGGNEEGALKFLEYATAEEQVKYLMENFGYIAADKGIAETQFEGDEAMTMFTQQLEYAQPRGPLPEWPEVSDAISLAFNQAITGESSPEDAAAAAQATIDGVVQ